MKAIAYDRYGPPSVLRYANVPQPTTGDREVLVKVRAASLNFADRAAMRGLPRLGRLSFGLRRPKAPSRCDISGIIAQSADEGSTSATPCRQMEQRAFVLHCSSQAFPIAEVDGITFDDDFAPVAATTALRAIRLTGSVLIGQCW
jgi:hypothetical protein